jgi:hypothetical protein
MKEKEEYGMYSKTLVFMLAIALLAAAGLSAQVPPVPNTVNVNSLLLQTSQGVFTNELDAASSVKELSSGPGFSELESSYLFGGLANIDLTAATGTTGGSSPGLVGPLTLGYYQAADIPWSVFVKFEKNDFGGQNKKTVTIPGGGTATKPVGSTDYTYVTAEVTREYETYWVELMDDEAQVLMGFGPWNVGLFAGFERDNDFNQSDNLSATYEYFADTAGGGSAPDTSKDYEISVDKTDFLTGGTGKTTDLSFGIPIYYGGGMTRHYGNLDIDYSKTDRTREYQAKYTTPQINENQPDTPTEGGPNGTPTATPAGNNTYQEVEKDNVSEIATTFGLDATYEIILPAFFGDNDANEVLIGTNLGFTSHGGEYSTDYVFQNYDYGSPGGSATRLTRNDDSTSTTLEASNDFDFSAWFQHAFYFDVGAGVEFGIRPAASLGYERVGDTGGDPRITKQKIVDRRDLTGDGDFGDAGDEIETTTIKYDDAVWNVTAASAEPASPENNFTASVWVPTGVTVQPDGWKFGVALGSTPNLSYTLGSSKVEYGSKTTTVVNDGTGAEQSRTEQDNSGANQTTTNEGVQHEFTIEATHNLSVFVDINESVRVDVDLNGNNLLDFDSLTIQAIIALP